MCNGVNVASVVLLFDSFLALLGRSHGTKCLRFSLGRIAALLSWLLMIYWHFSYRAVVIMPYLCFVTLARPLLDTTIARCNFDGCTSRGGLDFRSVAPPLLSPACCPHCQYSARFHQDLKYLRMHLVKDCYFAPHLDCWILRVSLSLVT